MLILGLLVISSLSGCSELVERTHINDYVTITYTKYHPGYSTTELMGNTIYEDDVDPSYIVKVQYKGKEEWYDDEELYKKYKDKIGEKIKASIRVDKYDDGTVKYIIESIE